MTITRATLSRIFLGIYLLLVAFSLLFGLAVPAIVLGLTAALAGVFVLAGG